MQSQIDSAKLGVAVCGILVEEIAVRQLVVAWVTAAGTVAVVARCMAGCMNYDIQVVRSVLPGSYELEKKVEAAEAAPAPLVVEAWMEQPRRVETRARQQEVRVP